MQNQMERADLIVRAVLRDILALDEVRVADFTDDSELFGALPELDSMAVAGLLTEVEDRADILIDDDEVDGEIFETFGNLVAFVARKMTG
ncbi:MAG: acyl carrier protein [Parasphingorhabdus sp.]|nr:acyl carrier protein [Parasphingorhabdus sp.]